MSLTRARRTRRERERQKNNTQKIKKIKDKKKYPPQHESEYTHAPIVRPFVHSHTHIDVLYTCIHIKGLSAKILQRERERVKPRRRRVGKEEFCCCCESGGARDKNVSIPPCKRGWCARRGKVANKLHLVLLYTWWCYTATTICIHARLYKLEFAARHIIYREKVAFAQY